MLNIPRIENFNKEFIQLLNQVCEMLLSVLIIEDSTALRSSDYVDALDLGIKPEEGSQYWVAPVISEYMNKHFSEELKTILYNNQKVKMNLFG